MVKEAEHPRWGLVVADAGWFTTESLFKAVDPASGRHVLAQMHGLGERLEQAEGPLDLDAGTRRVSGGRSEREFILPPGWIGRFPRWGMAPIARAVRRWRRGLGRPLALVITYPQYLELRDQVRPDALIYYNVDDYRLYWPGQAARIEALEHRAVRESDLTVCVARVRADELRAALPESAHKIHHIPHGAPAEALAPGAVDGPEPAPADIAHLPRPLLGYVGSLEDRVDWALLGRVADAIPAASIVLVGRVSPSVEPWAAERARCLARPNVHAVGWRVQAAIHPYNRSFDVAIIPYGIDHPFNIACCPTKIMDGLASARPIVSTDLPECRLHPGLIAIAEPGADGFVASVRSILHRGSDDGRGRDRLAWAAEHTCERVVDDLLDRLDRLKQGPDSSISTRATTSGRGHAGSNAPGRPQSVFRRESRRPEVGSRSPFEGSSSGPGTTS